MIQDSNILKWFKAHKTGWVFTLFAQPSLYLYTLTKRTLLMGILVFAFCEVLDMFNLKQQLIPSTLHSILGIVIGLLLVFRTNTAYDRWWEARKLFSSLQSSLIYLRVKLRNIEKKDETIIVLTKINKRIFNYVAADHESAMCKKKFLEHFYKLNDLIHSENLEHPILANVERKLSEILDIFTMLERIKDTPIPISYSLHIKLSIVVFLLTLPIGLFYGLGLWVVPLIMILFFIISGIEIISNEIENPFKGDPNDLPIDDFRKETENYIN